LRIDQSSSFRTSSIEENAGCTGLTPSTISSNLIPNLYFSTAQINILSLSIFLASALNSEKYDCIFIDDPIQSMDSINVLSTIDLLRSIALSYDKQIILSTHDENFHNLLKKKMPPDLFKSALYEVTCTLEIQPHP
jgi:DNA repair protein SbcC/Rad50